MDSSLFEKSPAAWLASISAVLENFDSDAEPSGSQLLY